MGPVFFIFLGILIAWALAGRFGGARKMQPLGPDPHAETIDRLDERIGILERIITDRDWQLRRDFDDLGN